MQAVILAGGLGTRLRPLTYKIPKHMAKINNKPFLEHLINMLSKNGVDDIVLCIGHLWGQIKNYFGDGKKFGVKIQYSIEKNLMGTGGALKQAGKRLKNNFFIIYGDSYLELDYRKLMELHKKASKMATIVVYANKSKAYVKDNIEIDKKGYVMDYNKKNPNKKMKYVDAGVLVMEKSVLKLIPANKKISLEEDIFPKLIKRKELYSFKSNKRFYDIGTFQRLKVFRKVLA